MRDYDGDMKPFQDALAKKGITQEMLDKGGNRNAWKRSY